MIYQLNLAAIFAVTSQAIWKRAKPVILRDVFLLPTVGFLGIILLWWFAATFLTDLMPTPLEAIIDNTEYANPVWDQWNRLNLSAVFLAVIVIGVTGLVLDYGLGRLQIWVTHHPVLVNR